MFAFKPHFHFSRKSDNIKEKDMTEQKTENFGPKKEKSAGIRENVLREMAECEKSYSDNSQVKERGGDFCKRCWPTYFFNNFVYRLPDEARNLFESSEVMDKLIFSKEKGKRRGMTPREFFHDIDKTIEELGFSRKDLEDFFWACEKEKDYRPLLTGDFFDLYLRLREKGYSHDDLTL
ncbi:MAG: hypothetical protein M1127_02800 [Patescibacteria group bacterium]|nr:hypothetical protein [Patescibacteria group bacterium]